jgi:Na+/pantothenate symporter
MARFAGINDHRNIPFARRMAVSWTGIGLVCALMIGVLGNGLFPDGIPDQERIFMFMVGMLFNPVISSVLLTAILAAAMSTADSQFLNYSSTIADDIYKAVFRKHASQIELVLVGRLAVLGVSSVALLLALAPGSDVLALGVDRAIHVQSEEQVDSLDVDSLTVNPLILPADETRELTKQASLSAGANQAAVCTLASVTKGGQQ